MRFNHRLIYSTAKKNSTAKPRYFRNCNVDLSSQLGYSSKPQSYRTANRTSSIQVGRGSHFLSEDSRPTLSPINHTNSHANLNSNASRPNGQSTPNHSHANYRTTSTNPAVANLVDSRPLTDENNNSVADAYGGDYVDYIDAPMCYSYMRDVAIYGVPSDDRKKTFRMLLNWWLFSLVFDLKWFFRKQWKQVALLVLLFIVFELCYCYSRGRSLRSGQP